MYAAYALARRGRCMSADVRWRGQGGGAPEVDSVRVPVPGLAVRRVQVLDTVVTAADQPVVRDLRAQSSQRAARLAREKGSHHDAGNRRQKHRVGREVRREVVGALE